MSNVVPWLEPDQRTALVKEADQWTDLAERVASYVVVDDDTAAYARDMARKARGVLQELEAKRKGITGPLLQAKKATDDLFKPTTTAVERIKRTFEQALASYDLAREQARAAVLVQSAAEIAVGIVPTEPIPEPVHVEKTSVRHVWEPEIVDADAVPRELCSPDLAKIKAEIWYADTPHKEPRPIPGVRFSLKSIVVVR